MGAVGTTKKATRRPAATPARRVRRAPEEARRLILTAAEKRLIEGGPDLIRVQVVARDVGMTDAAVHHHFGNRRGLLEALLRQAGRSLRKETEKVLADWNGKPEGLTRIAEQIAEMYIDRGYSRLALWLSLSGRAGGGSGMFEPLVDAVHKTRLASARANGSPRPHREDAQHAVALLNLALAADPLLGSPFLRSVSLPDDAAARKRFRRWLVKTMVGILLP